MYPKCTLSRRSLLRTGMAGAALSAVAPLQAMASASELFWSVWESNGNPDYVAPFETATGIDIRQNYMTGNDAQFAGLRAGAEWDIINPSISEMQQYIASGLLQPLQTERLQNASAMYDALAELDVYRSAEGAVYGLPYLWGANPITYRKDLIPEEPSYSSLWDTRYAGKMSMRDYPLEAIAIAGIYVGIPREELYNMTTEQLAECKTALLAQKPLLRSYWQSIGDLTNQFATEEVTIAFAWRVPYDVLKDRLPIAMARPAEGVFGWCNCVSLPRDLPESKMDAAYAFIDYLLGPEYAMLSAMDGNFASSTDLIRDELTQEHRADLFIDDLDVMKGFLWPTKPANYDEWVKLWAEVKAS